MNPKKESRNYVIPYVTEINAILKFAHEGLGSHHRGVNSTTVYIRENGIYWKNYCDHIKLFCNICPKCHRPSTPVQNVEIIESCHPREREISDRF